MAPPLTTRELDPGGAQEPGAEAEVGRGQVALGPQLQPLTGIGGERRRAAGPIPTVVDRRC